MTTDPYRQTVVPGSLAVIMAMLSPIDAGRLQETFQFAAAAHQNQVRDEGSPFIEHPVRVTQILWQELGNRDIDMLLAALTHDVLEDCPWISRAVLASLIGEPAVQIVEDVTKQSVPDEMKTERDRAYLDRLPHLPIESRLVKLADRIDNLRGVPKAGRPEKARHYLDVSRAEFIPLALATDQVAARLIMEACDAIERYLDSL